MVLLRKAICVPATATPHCEILVHLSHSRIGPVPLSDLRKQSVLRVGYHQHSLNSVTAREVSTTRSGPEVRMVSDNATHLGQDFSFFPVKGPIFITRKHSLPFPTTAYFVNWNSFFKITKKNAAYLSPRVTSTFTSSFTAHLLAIYLRFNQLSIRNTLYLIIGPLQANLSFQWRVIWR